jgi:glycosyltransferase involved in cell wall biosynthesis
MAPNTWPAKTSLRGVSATSDDGAAPRVSVVTPTHDRASMVVRAIASVLAQTFRDFELIVVDDGSTDNTADVVAAISDPRLRFARLVTSGGASRARNAGIAVARGEWVAFLDDDDEWLPQMLEVQLARLVASTDPRTSAVYCLIDTVTEDDGIVPVPYELPLPEGDVLDSILARAHTVFPSAHVVRRSALLQVGGFDETFRAVEDRDLWVRLALAGHHFVAVPEVLVLYHAEHKGRLNDDGVLFVQSFARYERRWGSLARKRLSRDVYLDDLARRRKWLEAIHRRQVKRLVRKGNRVRAWRYVRAMTPTLVAFPWAARYVARALSVVAFGTGASGRRRGRGAENQAYQALRADKGDDPA